MAAALFLESSKKASALGDDTLQLVNHERVIRRIPLLERSTELDKLALQHAKRMAKQQRAFHSVSNLEQLQAKLGGRLEVGENVQMGESTSTFDLHEKIMSSTDSVQRINILSNVFDEFGMGVARDRNGRIYMAQLFRSDC